MKNQQRQHKNALVCPVCIEPKQQLFQLADCGHKFCSVCCIGYIQSQAQNFAKARCLQQGCLSELNNKKQIYKQLDAATISKIDQYKLFLYLQGNKDAVACKKSDCKGYFLKSADKGICNACQSLHCLKCYELKHEGICVSNKQEEEEMRKLNYRRCPKCSIWVEKIAGCEYISCKCGIQFCYRCGEEYAKDPCRKGPAWKKQAEIRKLMKNMQLTSPSDIPSLFLLMFRMLMMVLIVVPFTAIYCIVPMVAIVGVIEILVFLLMPLVLFYAVSTAQNCNCKWLGYITLVIFYPVIGALFALIAFIVLLLYPYARSRYHHGVYDPIDMLLLHMTTFYLKSINLVVMCCCI